MQLRLDAADRLVELVEDRRGPVPADEAARKVLNSAARSRRPRALAARRSRRRPTRAFAGRATSSRSRALGDELLLERATYVVFDLETTGLRPGTCRPCEIGAVRVRGLELGGTVPDTRNPGAPLQPAVAALTGLRDADLRRAPPVAAGIRRFLEFSGDAVLVAHNARFDMAFLDNETMRLTGSRVAATVVDTVGLARRLLGRQPANLSALSHRFVTEAGRATVRCPTPRRPRRSSSADRDSPGARRPHGCGSRRARGTRPRRSQGKRSLAFGAPQTPGVYLFRDRHDQVLYVGKARDLRARLRSYFRSDRQRPAVEAALGALERIEWRTLGSEFEAALEECG